MTGIGLLEILSSLAERVAIPRAVAVELGRGGERRASEAAARQPWITVVDVSEPDRDALSTSGLDQGEAEAISLARRLEAPLLIDERRGRRVATTLGLRMTGTLGVLVAAKRYGLIPRVAAFLDLLEGDGFFVSRSLREATLEQAGERPGE